MPEDVQGQVPTDDTQVVQSDATTDADTSKTFDEEYVKGLRVEAAKYRKELQALKQQQEQANNATLSEVDRLKKQVETLQKERDDLTARQRKELMGRAIEKAASKVGVDAELATGLLTTDDLDLDDDETPKQIEKRLRQLVQKWPHIAKTPDISPTNGGATGNKQAMTYTRSQLKDPTFFQKHRADILKAAQEGRILDE